MKYRGNFDVDACERQFEKTAQREAHKLGEADFEMTLKRTLDGAKRKAGRKRARGKRFWREEQ